MTVSLCSFKKDVCQVPHQSLNNHCLSVKLASENAVLQKKLIVQLTVQAIAQALYLKLLLYFGMQQEALFNRYFPFHLTEYSEDVRRIEIKNI